MIDPEQLTQAVKEYARSVGFDLVAVTTAEPFDDTEQVIVERTERGLMDGLSWFTVERARFCCRPANHLPEARSLIALGMSYLTDPAASVGPIADATTTMTTARPLRGRVARYAWGADYHQVIQEKLRQVADFLRRQHGGRAKVFVDHGRIVDRAVAARAGLGWYGRNTNILTRRFGSWVFLAEILTDLPLLPDRPLRTHCGSCTRCLDACPTGALVAPGVLDNRRCISFLTIELRGAIPRELRPLMGDWIFGCDICQEVCPVNRHAEAPAHPAYQSSRGLGPRPDLVELLGLSEEAFARRFRGTPIWRTGRRGLLRNVAVALGNLGDPAAVPALITALDDHEHRPVDLADRAEPKTPSAPVSTGRRTRRYGKNWSWHSSRRDPAHRRQLRKFSQASRVNCSMASPGGRTPLR